MFTSWGARCFLCIQIAVLKAVVPEIRSDFVYWGFVEFWQKNAITYLYIEFFRNTTQNILCV